MTAVRARLWLIGAGQIALVCTLVAAALWIFVLPTGFDIAWPIVYQGGDSLQSATYVKRILEAHWFPFRTDLLGAPFGAADFDYPESEAANYVIFALLGMFSKNWVIVSNLYILAGFFLAAISAFIFLRWLGVQAALAVAGSILFAFLPYHFMRLVPLGHVLLATYWNVPIALWAALTCWPSEHAPRAGRRTVTLRGAFFIVALLAVASGGIYYAFFACFLILVAAVAAALAQRTVHAAMRGALAIAVIVVVVGIQLAPSFYFLYTNGINREAAVRSPSESEIYGLKLTQLVLPQPNHPLPAFRELSARYANTTPYTNENRAAALGSLGVAGLIVIGTTILVRLSRGGGKATSMDKLALLACAAIGLGTVAGLGAIFSLIASSQIRAYNRVSIFVGLIAIAALTLALSDILRRVAGRHRARNVVTTLFAAALLTFGLWDQAIPFDQRASAAVFLSDHDFFHRLEEALPPHTSVYQLPYRPYPEATPLHLMIDYEHFRGYLHTTNTRWSYGGMKGREGDRWLRSISSLPIKEQIADAARSGFGAVYVNRRAYTDGGAAVDDALRASLGAPIVTSSDASLAVYRMKPTGNDPARPPSTPNH